MQYLKNSSALLREVERVRYGPFRIIGYLTLALFIFCKMKAHYFVPNMWNRLLSASDNTWTAAKARGAKTRDHKFVHISYLTFTNWGGLTCFQSYLWFLV